MANEDINNLTTEFYVILLFYIISSILVIGVLINIIFLTRWGNNLRITFLKKFAIIYILSKILLWMSVFYFPIVSFYLFTRYYVQKYKTLY